MCRHLALMSDVFNGMEVAREEFSSYKRRTRVVVLVESPNVDVLESKENAEGGKDEAAMTSAKEKPRQLLPLQPSEEKACAASSPQPVDAAVSFGQSSKGKIRQLLPASAPRIADSRRKGGLEPCASGSQEGNDHHCKLRGKEGVYDRKEDSCLFPAPASSTNISRVSLGGRPDKIGRHPVSAVSSTTHGAVNMTVCEEADQGDLATKPGNVKIPQNQRTDLENAVDAASSGSGSDDVYHQMVPTGNHQHHLRETAQTRTKPKSKRKPKKCKKIVKAQSPRHDRGETASSSDSDNLHKRADSPEMGDVEMADDETEVSRLGAQRGETPINLSSLVADVNDQDEAMNLTKVGTGQESGVGVASLPTSVTASNFTIGLSAKMRLKQQMKAAAEGSNSTDETPYDSVINLSSSNTNRTLSGSSSSSSSSSPAVFPTSWSIQRHRQENFEPETSALHKLAEAAERKQVLFLIFSLGGCFFNEDSYSK